LECSSGGELKEDNMEEVFSGFLQQLLELILVAVVPAAVALAVAWLKVKQKEIESKLPAEVLSTIQNVATMVVLAAEQSELSGWLEEEGMKKKEWAMLEGEKLLKQNLGLVLDLNKLGDVFWDGVLSGLDVAVEKEVYGQNGWGSFRKPK